MSNCPRLCPLCAGREFYLLPIGDRWICAFCAPPADRVPIRLKWIDEEEPLEEPPLGELVPLGTGALLEGVCRICNSDRRWRLKPSGPWICSVCHPPLPAPEEIEWEKELEMKA